MRRRSVLAVILVLVVSSGARAPAADTLPSQLSDEAFWKILSDFSEPDGYFQYTVITSNETAYQEVLPQLTKSIPPGGVYLGVGPEQNFTYIAALRPKIAFIIDIRRDMMLEHLIYKCIFEMSASRIDFVSNLFSRRPPAGLTPDASVDAIFRAFARVTGDSELGETTLKSILSRLKSTHGFPIVPEDEKRIRNIFLTFLREGVVTFNSSIESPGYAALMTATDQNGRNWSFLASRENYDRLRTMQANNLIVPLVGDFGGSKTIRMTGQYVRDHGAIVSVFYLSNVEDYLQNVMQGYVRNIASLPVNEQSLFIHVSLGTNSFRPWLDRIVDLVPPRGLR